MIAWFFWATLAAFVNAPARLRNRAVFLVLALSVGLQAVEAEPILFPPSRQRLENDTYAAVVRFFQQVNQQAILNLINRDPLIARRVLIRFLREPNQLSLAQQFAALFPASCDSELEGPLLDFYIKASAETRVKLLHWVEAVTDGENWVTVNDYPDRFSREARQQALSDFQKAADEFQSLGFLDGQAYGLSLWALYVSDSKVDVQTRLAALESALGIFEKLGNVRGEILCLRYFALIYQDQDEEEKSAQFLERAWKKAASTKDFILKYALLLARTQDEKKRQETLANLWSQLEMEPGLRPLKYQFLLWPSQPAKLEQFQAMLDAEPDPILKVKAEWYLFEYFRNSDDQPRAVEAASRAIELAQKLDYDMAAYASQGSWNPAVPSMLFWRAQAKMDMGKAREAESDFLNALSGLDGNAVPAEIPYVEQLKTIALNALSSVYRSLGEYPLATEKASQALQISRQREIPLWIAWACQNLAEISADLGDLATAEQYLQEAARQPNPFFNAAPIALAELHLNFQLYEEALRDLEEADRGMKEFIKRRPSAQKTSWWITQRLRLLTHMWLRLGEPERALEAARELEKRIHFVQVVEQGALGIVLAAMGRHPEAEKYFKERLASLKGKTWPGKEADALKNLGKICREQNRRDEALKYLAAALELYRQMGRRRDEVEVLLELGQVSLEKKDLIAAARYFRDSLTRAEEMQEPQGIWSARYGLARIARANRQKREAIEHLKAAVEAVELVSGHIKIDLHKSGFLENKIVLYDELIRLLGPTHPAEAFHYAERRRARAFLESAQKVRAFNPVDPRNELWRKKQQAEARLIGKQRALLGELSKPADQRNDERTTSLSRELVLIRNEHTQLLKSVELANPSEAARQGVLTPATVSQIQQETLTPGQVLVEYVVTHRELLAFIVTQKDCKFLRLPVGRKTLAGQIEQLHLPFRQLRQGAVDLLHIDFDVGLAHQLYQEIFEPIELQIKGEKRILVIPDDVLNYLPFETLARSESLGQATPGLRYSEYDDVDWLLRHYTISYALSATSLDRRLRNPAQPSGPLLAFGNAAVSASQKQPIAQAVLRGASPTNALMLSLSPLPQAYRETKSVARLMAGKAPTRVFTGEQATERVFYQAAPSAAYLHFAVHSLLNEAQPNYSALVLAPDKDSDGLLQTYEIANTRLNSRLVTLSGCETALGKLFKGEGLVGLQRAFLQAGAKTVVVSLWSVEDSTADFMEAFYKHVSQDLTLPAALRKAKLEYLQKSLPVGSSQRLSLSHPFFWAPFVMTTVAIE